MKRILALSVLLLPALAVADEAPFEQELSRVRAMRDEQSYREALALAELLAGRHDLDPTNRLDALREVAMLRLILREEAGAREALATALARDPGFDLGPGDHPPRFVAALADARYLGRAAVTVRLAPSATLREGSADFAIAVGEGQDAVERIVVTLRSGGSEWSTLQIDLPPWGASAPVPAGAALEYFVEACAPSGAVLASAGSRSAPLVVAPPASAAALAISPAREPVVRRARREPAVRRGPSGGGVPLWVWIAGGAALVAGGVTAGILATQPDAAREGSWGSVELGE
ncbi:MAG: hypothetical protein HYY06_24440 [Deltaproteobacteria bacterium]|nr:hypothetical protein [Deltaproteobacteria bacterium]